VHEESLINYLRSLYPKENESCEWKECSNLKNSWSSRPGDDIESYVSALANMNGGHLVLGVKDGTLDIIGINVFGDYTPENARHRLAARCAHLNSERLHIEVFVTSNTAKTVWVMHIPKHDARLPVYAHGKPWQRVGDSIVPMRSERLTAILNEPLASKDWSAEGIEGATVADLDEDAIVKAREKFAEKHKSERWADQIHSWDTMTFLDKAKLTIQGFITRTAILLLGKPESVHFVSPALPEITWALDAEERSYKHFGPPFLLTTTDVLRQIRNVPQKLFPQDQLLAVEIPKYETRTILEALHNCLAHQDYERGERIVVTEMPDRLIFENAGNFIDGSPDDYFSGQRVPKRYRNHWLADAMFQVGMIDRMGYGINEMTLSQMKRYLPLPSYSGSSSDYTRLEVLGRPIDLNYTQLLLERQDLDLDTVILLDRVQKKLPIEDSAAKMLRRNGLIEGRKPQYHVSAKVASATNAEVKYTHTRGVEKEQLKQMVITHLRKFNTAGRSELDKLLVPVLSSDLTDKQKRGKITNLLSEMKRKDGSIQSVGRGPKAYWSLSKGSMTGEN